MTYLLNGHHSKKRAIEQNYVAKIILFVWFVSNSVRQKTAALFKISEEILCSGSVQTTGSRLDLLFPNFQLKFICRFILTVIFHTLLCLALSFLNSLYFLMNSDLYIKIY